MEPITEKDLLVNDVVKLSMLKERIEQSILNKAKQILEIIESEKNDRI